MANTIQITSMRSTILELVENRNLLNNKIYFTIIETDSFTCKKREIVKIEKLPYDDFHRDIFNNLSTFYLIRESKKVKINPQSFELYKNDIRAKFAFDFLWSGELFKINFNYAPTYFYYYNSFEERHIPVHLKPFIVNKARNTNKQIVVRHTKDELLIFMEELESDPLVVPSLPDNDDIILHVEYQNTTELDALITHFTNLPDSLPDMVKPQIEYWITANNLNLSK
jgi:hypothetical protein